MVSACLLDREPALRYSVVVHLLREPHHVRAVVDRCCAAPTRECLLQEHSSPAAHFDQVIIGGQREFLQDHVEIRIVVERVTVDGTRLRA